MVERLRGRLRRRFMPVSLCALVATLTFLVTGCASDVSGEAGSAPTPSEHPPFISSDGDPIVSCGDDEGWPASAMAGGVESSIDRSVIIAALERLVNEAGIDAPTALRGTDIEDAEWFVLTEDESALTVATGPWSAEGPAPGAQTVSLERENGSWRANGWGDCQLAPVLPSAESWVQLLRSRTKVDPKSTSVPVRVTEIECTSGRDPGPYLHEPVIVEESDSVTVYWTSSAPPTGFNTCQGGPVIDRVITLTEPLGDRALLDGSSWPAEKLGTHL